MGLAQCIAINTDSCGEPIAQPTITPVALVTPTIAASPTITPIATKPVTNQSTEQPTIDTKTLPRVGVRLDSLIYMAWLVMVALIIRNRVKRKSND